MHVIGCVRVCVYVCGVCGYVFDYAYVHVYVYVYVYVYVCVYVCVCLLHVCYMCISSQDIESGIINLQHQKRLFSLCVH